MAISGSTTKGIFFTTEFEKYLIEQKISSFAKNDFTECPNWTISELWVLEKKDESNPGPHRRNPTELTTPNVFTHKVETAQAYNFYAQYRSQAKEFRGCQERKLKLR